MRKYFAVMVVLAFAALGLSGCGKVDGPRFWWDDRNQERLPETYALPADPAAPTESGQEEKKPDASGEDLTDSDLWDYRTDHDAQEQRNRERFIPEPLTQQR